MIAKVSICEKCCKLRFTYSNGKRHFNGGKSYCSDFQGHMWQERTDNISYVNEGDEKNGL